MPGTSATRVAALNPRLITAVHPSSSGLLAAAATELAARAGEMWEDDLAFAMDRVRDALETLGELFAEEGAMHDMQETDAAAGNCHKAAWSMRDAAREITAALAAQAQVSP